MSTVAAVFRNGVFAPDGDVDLTDGVRVMLQVEVAPPATVTVPPGTFSVVWFDTASGRETEAVTVTVTVTHVGSHHAVAAPFDGDAVLYLKAVK